MIRSHTSRSTHTRINVHASHRLSYKYICIHRDIREIYINPYTQTSTRTRIQRQIVSFPFFFSFVVVVGPGMYSLWKPPRDIVARIYGEYEGSEQDLYYADDSAIRAIHCESFNSLCVEYYVLARICAMCYYIAYRKPVHLFPPLKPLPSPFSPLP